MKELYYIYATPLVFVKLGKDYEYSIPSGAEILEYTNNGTILCRSFPNPMSYNTIYFKFAEPTHIGQKLPGHNYKFLKYSEEEKLLIFYKVDG